MLPANRHQKLRLNLFTIAHHCQLQTVLQQRRAIGIRFIRFYRRFILPETVDADKVKATDRHGVLEIHIPKQAKAMPRRIKVAA